MVSQVQHHSGAVACEAVYLEILCQLGVVPVPHLPSLIRSCGRISSRCPNRISSSTLASSPLSSFQRRPLQLPSIESPAHPHFEASSLSIEQPAACHCAYTGTNLAHIAQTCAARTLALTGLTSLSQWLGRSPKQSSKSNPQRRRRWVPRLG